MTLLDRLPDIAAWMRTRGVSELEWTEHGTTLALSLAPTERTILSSASGSDVEMRSVDQFIPSPEMGIFRLDSQGGDRIVHRDDIVGFVEIGPLRIPVVCPDDGWLGQPLEEDGAVVGYGRPLFRIDTGSRINR